MPLESTSGSTLSKNRYIEDELKLYQGDPLTALCCDATMLVESCRLPICLPPDSLYSAAMLAHSRPKLGLPSTILCILVTLVLGISVGRAPDGGAAAPGTVAYPLKASANGRYLVDQNNVPFPIVGDSPQSLIGNLSVVQAATWTIGHAMASTLSG